MLRGGFITPEHGELLLRHTCFALKCAVGFADVRQPLRLNQTSLRQLYQKAHRLAQQLCAFRMLRPTWLATLPLIDRGDTASYTSLCFLIEASLMTRVYVQEWRASPSKDVTPTSLQQLFPKAPAVPFMSMSADSLKKAYSVLIWKFCAPRLEEPRTAAWIQEITMALDLVYKRSLWLVAHRHEEAMIEPEWRRPVDTLQAELAAMQGDEEEEEEPEESDELKVGVVRSHTCDASLKFATTMEICHSWLYRELLESRMLPEPLPLTGEEREQVDFGVRRMASRARKIYRYTEPYALREPWRRWEAGRRVAPCSYEVYKKVHSVQFTDDIDPREVLQKMPEIDASFILNNDKWTLGRWFEEGDPNWITDFLLLQMSVDKIGYSLENLMLVDNWYDRPEFVHPILARLRTRDAYLVFTDGDWSKCAPFPTVAHCVSWLTLTRKLPDVYTMLGKDVTTRLTGIGDLFLAGGGEAPAPPPSVRRGKGKGAKKAPG